MDTTVPGRCRTESAIPHASWVQSVDQAMAEALVSQQTEAAVGAANKAMHISRRGQPPPWCEHEVVNHPGKGGSEGVCCSDLSIAQER
jgi:hypothetical protein